MIFITGTIFAVECLCKQCNICVENYQHTRTSQINSLIWGCLGEKLKHMGWQ